MGLDEFIKDGIPRGAVRWALLVFAAVLLTRLSGLLMPFFCGDEATYSALAARLLSGELPYAGAVDHKPPGINLTYALSYLVAGQNHLLAVRFLLIVVVTVTALLIGRAATRITGRRETRIAALLYAGASACGLAGDVQTANTELFLNLPLSMAALLCLDAIQKGPGRIRVGIIAAGALTAVAGLYKYQSSLAMLGWAPAIWMTSRPLAERVRDISLLAAGYTAVALAFLAFFVVTGTWRDFLLWGWLFNFQYMGSLGPLEMLWRRDCSA